MRFAAAFIQESTDYGLTMRQQQLCIERAAHKLGWHLCAEMVEPAGTENAALSLRGGIQDLLADARVRAYDVLLVLDANHLHCSEEDLQGLIAALGREDIHIFGVRDGYWIEPYGRRWMLLPGFEMYGAGYEVESYA